MRKLTPTILLAISLCILSCAGSSEQSSDDLNTEFVVIGYVPGFRGIIDETTIDAENYGRGHVLAIRERYKRIFVKRNPRNTNQFSKNSIT